MDKQPIPITKAPVGKLVYLHSMDDPTTVRTVVLTDIFNPLEEGDNPKYITCNMIEIKTPSEGDVLSQYGHNLHVDNHYVTPLSGTEKRRIFARKEMREKLLWYIPLSGCTIGADPEVFIVDKNDIVIPAFKFLPSKKEGNPFWDGFQCEFTIPNSTCLAYMTDNVQGSLKRIYDLAVAYNKEAKMVYKDVVDIPLPLLMEADPEHIALGCAPSLNVYNTKPIHVGDPSVLPFRFAGCHLHFGGEFSHPYTQEVVTNMVKTMDIIFGITSVSLLQGMEDIRRRKFYGRAGEYRLPSHGLEYRVPSSAILAHPALFHLSYGLARAGFFLGKRFKGLIENWNVSDDKIKHIINNYDVIEAQKVLDKNYKLMKLILSRLFSPNTIIQNALWRLIKEGAINHMDITDMAGNWRLYNFSWVQHSGAYDCTMSDWLYNHKLSK